VTVIEQLFTAKGEIFAKNGAFKEWHNIGKTRGVKKSKTYKAITVAIGILVAMVIAITLWVRVPRDVSVTDFRSKPHAHLPAPIRKLISTALVLVSELKLQ